MSKRAKVCLIRWWGEGEIAIDNAPSNVSFYVLPMQWRQQNVPMQAIRRKEFEMHNDVRKKYRKAMPADIKFEANGVSDNSFLARLTHRPKLPFIVIMLPM